MIVSRILQLAFKVAIVGDLETSTPAATMAVEGGG